MSKLDTYFMMLAVALTSRRYRGSKERTCNYTYIKKLTQTEEMQKCIPGVHPDISLEKPRLNNVIDKELQSTYQLADKTITCNSHSPKICLVTRSDNNNHRRVSFSHAFNSAFIIAGIVFVSGLAFLSQNHIKQVYATENTTRSETDPALVFFLTNPTGNFNATGSISSLVLSNNGTADPQYILTGNWNVLASNGNITEFSANFTMVSVNGTDRHIHSVTNFTSNVVAPLILDIHGTTFTGESDITTDDNVTWRAIQTTVTIARQDAIKITFNHNNVNNHFQNQPIYGVIFSIQEYNAPEQQQQ